MSATASGLHPFQKIIRAVVAAVVDRLLAVRAIAAAAGADAVITLPACPVAGRIVGVYYTPIAAVTGANTDTRTVAVVNKGNAGAGSTSIASLALVSATNLTALARNPLTLAATGTDRDVAVGDVLEFTSTHAGSGLADPGGTVEVVIAVDQVVPIGAVESDGVVSAVSYTPSGAIAGATTNNRTLSVINKGAAGSGSTAVASLALANTVNATAFDAKTIPVSATAADLAVTAGDVLVWSSARAGNGLADPGGLVEVTILRA